jgi:hypothetical protein
LAAKWDHVAERLVPNLGVVSFANHVPVDERLQRAIEEFRKRELDAIGAKLRKLCGGGRHRWRRRKPRPSVDCGSDRITIARMEQDVLEIAADTEIQIHWIDGYRARALSECLEIWLPRIRSAVSYATALHELGHCLGRYQASRSVMTVERWAWRWAKENALIWTSSWSSR